MEEAELRGLNDNNIKRDVKRLLGCQVCNWRYVTTALAGKQDNGIKKKRKEKQTDESRSG